MDNGILIVIIILLVLIVGVNGLLILGLRRGKGEGRIRMMQRAARRVSDPWGKENEQLKELSDLVEKLKDPDHEG
jgi:hypothetical protein